MDYKEVFQLAQEKGYDSIIVFPARYGGDAALPHEAINEAAKLCELTLIQKWLRDNICICTLIDLQPNGYYWYLHDLSLKQDRTISFSREYFDSYESALLEGINEALKLLP